VSQPVANRKFKYYNAIAIAFIICLITSNIAATKLWQVGSLILPGGMIIFPILYVLNDILTEVYGFTASRRVIWAALFSNLFVTLILFLVVQLPPAEHWSNHESFTHIFSLTPRIFLASISSYFIGELLNASTISTLKIMLEGRNFAIRAILSTCVGALIETTLFVSIAFSGILPISHLFSMIFTMTIMKVAYELIVLPITVKVTQFLKETEGMDSFEKPSWRGVFGC
jgi:queuosine precursor transporter